MISSLSVNLFICRLLSNDTALRQATTDSAFSINNISARKPRQLGCSNLQPTIQVFADMQASGPALYVQLLSDARISLLPLKKTDKKTFFPASNLTRLLFRGKDSSNCYSLSLSSSFPSSSRFMQFLLFANSLTLLSYFYA